MAHASLRRGRISISGQIYLVTCTTWQRRPIFAEFDAAALACRAISLAASRADARLLASVLMPDHWNGLVEAGGTPLSEAVRRIKGASARELGLRLPMLGRVWAPAFHDHALRRDEDLRAAARYVVANPLRAGLVGDVRDYPFWDAIWLCDQNPL